MSTLQLAWNEGYNACMLGIYFNPYDHDAEAQAWEDGFNNAFHSLYSLR